MNRVSTSLTLITATLMFCGCGRVDPWKSKRPATVPAQGVVTYKNQPLASAIVVIQPTEATGLGASALTDEQGKFVLQTFPPDAGAVPGSYAVMIMKMDPSTGVVPPNDEGSGAVPRQKSLIPERYSNPAKSGLKVDIPQQGNLTMQFDLER